MVHAKLLSLQAILRGAALAIRDPRKLATLTVERVDEREQRFEQMVHDRFGGPPRTVPIEAVIGRSIGRLDQFSYLDQTSTVLDLLLLKALVRRFAGAQYFEIGTFRGESAVAVAEDSASVVTLSLPDGRLRELGVAEDQIAAHRTFSNGHPRIEHVFADSAEFDVTRYAGWADVLFIDGDHEFHAVERDTRRFWHVHKPHDGIVVWHDGFQSPLQPRWEVLAGIMEGIPIKDRPHLVHVSNTLSVAWLPEGNSLPTVERSLVPRTAFSVEVGIAPTVGNYH
jgi:predicted O-methyltransferase YrrM